MPNPFNARRFFVNKSNDTPGHTVLWYTVDQPLSGEYQLWNEDPNDTVFIEKEPEVPGIAVPPGGHVKFRMNGRQEIRAHRSFNATGDGRISILVTDVGSLLPSGTITWGV